MVRLGRSRPASQSLGKCIIELVIAQAAGPVTLSGIEHDWYIDMVILL